MRRLAGDAGHGGITVSIPALDQRDTRSCRSSYDGPKGSVVTASYTNGASNVCYYARGYQPINKADGSTDVADYLLVESDDTDWPVNGYRTLELDVTPKREGTLTIYYRYWLCGSGYQDCTRFPTIGRVDQQGWNVGIITVPVRNQRPSVARVTPSSKRVRLRPGDTQTFEARATDRNDNISQVEWFVDDRSVSGESLVLTGSISRSFTYRFSNPGTYEVVAEFTDLEGDSDDVDWDVEVTDEINVTVGSNPSGRTISVDGTDRTAPYNTTWDSGTSHTLDVASPQRISGVGDRYVFSRWGHGGSQRQTVRPTSNATYTAYFNLQHFLSTRTEPRGVGIPGGGVWYDHGSTARVGPAPTLEGYRFSHWEKNGQNVGSNAAGVSVRVDAAFLVEAVYTAAVANRPPSVFVVSPLGSPELEPGDSQTFTARATDPDNNITQVEWFVNDRSEGGQSLAPTGLISRSFTYVFSNAGMYRVRATFTDTVGGTDSETWMVKVIPPTLNCFRDLGTLPLGRTSISGSWTGDCASTHQSGSYARFYAFTLTRRTQVQIDLRSAADAYLYLMRGSDSAGLIVDEDDDGGSTGNNSLLDLTLETGTYTVEATTLRSGATGNFSLDIDATAASINCFRNLGTLPTGTTSISGTWNGDCASTHQSGSYARFYAFTLTRRTRVQIDLRSSVDAYLYLLRGADSRGSIVDEDDDGGITGNNSLLDLTLETGTYTVEATTFRSGATGNFSLDIDATAASINCFRNLGTLPTGTTSISGTWNGDCASTHQSGSYARFYAFTLTRRTQVQIDLRSAADAYLYLLRGSDSAGLIVDEDDDGGSTGNNSLLDLTLEAGTYTVEATTFRSGATGNFSLDIDATAASINCFRNLGTLPTGTTSISGTWNGDCASTHQSGSYARFYAFTLTRRTQVQIDLRSAADAYLYLLRGSDSAGLIVDEDNDGGSTGNNSLLDLTLETGTYTVEATTLRSGATGNFSLDIDVDATPPAPPLLCIQTLSGVSPTEPGVSPIEGEWASDCLSEQRTGSYARYYTFTLPATPPGSSTKVTVNLESVVDTYLYLLAGEGSDGRVIASNNNGLNRNTHSQISEFLPGGAYTVEATTNQPAVAGEFFLTVSSITVTVPPPRIDDMRCAPLDALVGEVVDCRPTLSGGEPTRYLWGAIGGNPWSGMGEHFATRWDTPGEKRIVFEVCNDTGCDTGEQSITVDAIAPPPLPSVPLGDPTGLQASAAGPGQVRLTWSPGANADVQWLWSVKADGTGGQYIEASGITSIVTVAGLENGQNYWFTIIAGRNVNGIQEWSQWSQWVNSRVSGAVVQAADDDRAALLALYNATGGSNWANRTSWLSNSPIGQWHGVTTNDAGRVTGLNLQDNNVAGRISPALGMLTELQDLNFQGNELTGSIPTELGNLSNLTHLDLGYNELSGEIPQELGDLSNLTHLFLGFNELSGEIPRELGDLSNLTRLYLFGNRLSGEIPPELGDLSNLTRLILHDNQLTGEIPRELGDLSNLIHLILDENQLTGPIPPELGDLSNLTRLYLFGNRLSGEIPPELGNLSNLTRLFLHDNQLTGPIPSELGNLDNLVWLYLAGNQLTGCVPARFEDALNNDFDDLGRPFCGTAGGAPPASQQAPDLGVTLTISDAGLLYSGATATVTATVFNEGDGAAPGYTLLYYRSQDRRFTNDNVTNSASAGALPPSTNRISDLGFTVPADAGDYYFAACVGGVPGESDTTDNCSDWASASVLHPVTLTASDCRTETTLNTLGAVPDSTEISGTVLARRAVSQANVIWRVIDAFGNTDSSGIEQLGSMTAGETKDFSISTAWGGPNHTCDPELRWVY